MEFSPGLVSDGRLREIRDAVWSDANPFGRRPGDCETQSARAISFRALQFDAKAEKRIPRPQKSTIAIFLQRRNAVFAGIVPAYVAYSPGECDGLRAHRSHAVARQKDAHRDARRHAPRAIVRLPAFEDRVYYFTRFSVTRGGVPAGSLGVQTRFTVQNFHPLALQVMRYFMTYYINCNDIQGYTSQEKPAFPLGNRHIRSCCIWALPVRSAVSGADERASAFPETSPLARRKRVS
ncbi:hypothetical protein EVAR_22741_1 [Eumeta japonica]|uniref:Uncharacterized protein n=1 Tax=Eumeta variegata TaxID=151549 RepID=A0A4C1UST0_EUMVA|nr:hypothetical protein EVAR_22741_1 [Eumeta japonica]